MSTEYGYDGRDGAVAIRYEQRGYRGEVMANGVTGAARAWALHPKFGVQNVLKRVKSSAGIRWSVKTEKAFGEGDIVRRLPDGSTLHIWIIEGAPPPNRPAVDAPRIGRIVAAIADRVATGIMTLDDVVPYAMSIVPDDMFDTVDWRDAIEDELARRELGI